MNIKKQIHDNDDYANDDDDDDDDDDSDGVDVVEEEEETDKWGLMTCSVWFIANLNKLHVDYQC